MVQLIVTGFDKFANVETNPSKQIVQYIQSHLQEFSSILSSHILEVSTAAVVTFLSSLQSTIHSKATVQDPIVLLHFGVNTKATRFELEQRGKNEASFRVADEQGFQPTQQIVEDMFSKEIDHFLYSELPIQQWATELSQQFTQMNKKRPLFPNVLSTSLQEVGNEGKEQVVEQDQQLVGVSQSAGLFLCNYIYYKSLSFVKQSNDTWTQQTQQQNGDTKSKPFYSLFVHIPSFETISQEDQLLFVKLLVQQLVQHFTVHKTE